MVALDRTVGRVIGFAEVVRFRREREGRARHARCVEILADTVVAARAALAVAPPADAPVWVARVRKLEALHEWASGSGRW
jgi:hypothetical protein